MLYSEVGFDLILTTKYAIYWRSAIAHVHLLKSRPFLEFVFSNKNNYPNLYPAPFSIEWYILENESRENRNAISQAKNRSVHLSHGFFNQSERSS